MENLLEVKDVTKIYPGGVVANYKVKFTVREGEIHALVGENGAGKSTLMKMLFGFEDMTEGEFFFKGKKVHFTSSKDAIENGIGMVHQHFMLVPSFTVSENLTLGSEENFLKVFINEKKCRQATLEIADKYGFSIDVDKKVRDISVGMKQKLEILKVLYRGAKLIILDEPTAVLTPQETKELFEQLLILKSMKYTIIFISHKLDEVKYLCDRLTILKQGRSMGTYDVDQLTQLEISELMVGREIQFNYEKPEQQYGEAVLAVKDIKYVDKFGIDKLKGVSFKLREGEILGLAGVEGNGQSEVISIITGELKQDYGSVFAFNEDITNLKIADRREKGLANVPEDRMEDGCAQTLSVMDNLVTINIHHFIKNKMILDFKKMRTYAKELIKNFDILCKNEDQEIKRLSGGNIQKTIVAREFSLEKPILIINQPTRGIDVGSIEFIHKKILEKRHNGDSILLSSADLGELMALSDRILVFFKGEIVANIADVKHISEAELGLYMLGLKRDENSVLEGVSYAG